VFTLLSRLKPLMRVAYFTPGVSFRMASICCPTALVRWSDAPAGS
jgi:hypothetical protein